MRPDRVALLGYVNLSWGGRNQRATSDDSLPDSEARLDQAEQVDAALLQAGSIRTSSLVSGAAIAINVPVARGSRDGPTLKISGHVRGTR